MERITGPRQDPPAQESFDAEALLHTLFEQPEVGVTLVDRSLRFVGVNRAFGMFESLEPSEVAGKTIAEALPKFAAQVEEATRSVLETGKPIVGQEVRAPDPDDADAIRWFRVSRYPVRAGADEIVGVISTIVEITDLKNVQVQLDAALVRAEQDHARELEAKRAQLVALGRYRTIFEGASVGILRVDPEGRMIEANPAMVRMLGYSADELAHMHFREYTHPDDVEHNLHLFTELMAGRCDSYQLEKRCYRKDGGTVWSQVTAALERDEHGRPVGAISMFEDVTQRKLAEEAARQQALLNEHQARHDALTGLGNRRKLYAEVEERLAGLDDGDGFAIGIFDLDGFKAYNDTFGHPAGDALLARLGGRLSAALEGRGIAYRMGGDEFCVVTDSVVDADEVLDDARAALSDQGEQFFVRSSRGSVAVPTEATTLDGALQLADKRLYDDKRAMRQSESLAVRDALAQVIIEKSHELAQHGLNVAELAAATAARLGLSAEDVACTRVAAELHDIGKAAIPEAILNKPGPLDDGEWEFMKRHTLIGERIVAAAPALARIAPIVRSSHERPDGRGYPDGLDMSAIPLGARIVAVVDAFDAMVTGRPYRNAVGVGDAVAELRRCTGTQFDPAVVEAFVDVIDQMGSEARAA